MSDRLAHPSLTEYGRQRAESNAAIDLELVVDVYWDMEFCSSSDSDPITWDAETVDYGVNSSIACKF